MSKSWRGQKGDKKQRWERKDTGKDKPRAKPYDRKDKDRGNGQKKGY